MGGQGCLRSAVLLLPEPGFQASHTPSLTQCPAPLPSTSAFALLFSLDPLFSPSVHPVAERVQKPVAICLS